MGVTCKECGQEFGNLNRHLPAKHDISSEEYREKYGQDVSFESDEAKEKRAEAVSDTMQEHFEDNEHPWKGRSRSQQFKEEHSERMSGKDNPAKREEVRNKISESQSGEKNPMYNKTLTEEHRRKIGKANEGKSVPQEVRDKISESWEEFLKDNEHPRTGVDRSQEFKEYMSKYMSEHWKDNEHPMKDRKRCQDVINVLRQRTGEDNPNWNGGTSDDSYPVEFSRWLKEKIRIRDNRTCQMCGKSQEEEGRSLSVHHIDGNKDNCEEYNLIALCNTCNQKVEHIENRKEDKLRVMAKQNDRLAAMFKTVDKYTYYLHSL